MKQVVRYTNFTIPDKLTCETRITVDDRGVEYTSSFEGTKSSTLRIFPLITLTIIRPSEIDDNGNRVKAPWNQGDSIGMTKYNLPIFINKFKEIQNEFKTPDLYTYHGKRLDLNEEVAKNIRKVFPIGNAAVIEISATIVNVVENNIEKKVEGVKLKFNNEQHHVLLTLNDITSLIHNLDHLDVDSLGFQMYQAYISKPDKSSSNITLPAAEKPKVDIMPLEIPTDDDI